MKTIVTISMILSSMLLAATDKKEDSSKNDRVQKQIKEQMKKEQKYSREQTFYQGKYYDFKGAEVNKDSLDSVPEIPVDDFDMDSVYD